MAEPLKKRRTYWIADVVTPLLRERALLLSHKGFDVQFFTSLDALMTELTARRAGVIVVSDDGDEKVTERILLTLTAMSEIQGARLVMVRNTHSDRINFLAACANFRDIIPSNLDERLWLTRFLYATANRPVHYVQPTGQITLNNISAVSLPARMTWISDRKVRLECRVKPPVGASLSLTGAFAEAAGVSSISLKVTATERSRLLYRFSDAVVCEWNGPAAARDKALKAIADLRTHDPGPRCRIFVAVSKPEVRNELLSRFIDPRFEVATALQKQSIVDEPKFFTPDIVIIEEALCHDEGGVRFMEMMATLTDQATVIVLGRLNDYETLHKKYPNRRILQLSRVPKGLAESVLERYMPHRDQQSATGESGACNVMADHAFSMAEVSFPARLHRVHPLAAKIAMPFPIGNFALVRLDSPLLRRMIDRHPYVKLTTTYQDTHPEAPPFVHVADCYFADIDQVERAKIAQSLSRIVTDNLAKLDATGSFINSTSTVGETRTPELGSARSGKTRGLAAGTTSLSQAVSAAAAAPVPQVANIVAKMPEVVPTFVAQAQTSPVTNAVPQGKREIRSLDQLGSSAVDLSAEAQDLKEEKLIPKEQIAELAEYIMPALSPIAQVAGDLKLAADDVKRDVRRAVKKKRDFVTLLVKMALVGFTAAIVIFLFFYLLAPHYEHSGGVYSDQLKKFAPHLEQQPKQGE